MSTVPNSVQSICILAISLGLGIIATLILRSFAPEWCIQNRLLVWAIIGFVTIAPSLVMVFRMRKPL
jgi:hypothetical protein